MKRNDAIRLAQLGPKSLEMLAQADIHTELQLRNLGAVAAYWRVKQINPKASLNLLWAIEAALTMQDWRWVAQHERLRLLLELDQVSHQRISDPTSPATY